MVSAELTVPGTKQTPLVARVAPVVTASIPRLATPHSDSVAKAATATGALVVLVVLAALAAMAA